jgi:hypothetical protein
LWRQIFAAADEALELAPAQRREFVERWQTEHPELGDELRALIEADGV